MHMEVEYCLDPVSSSRCDVRAMTRPLGPGQTMFFTVTPKYSNVDIRVMLDITSGGWSEQSA